MRKIPVIIAVLFMGIQLHAQSVFVVTPQWDVRPGGSDTNGGAFDPTVVAPGTDESQGNTGTSLSCTVQSTTTQAICSPAISATTHGPGNYIYSVSGSGCTAATRFKLLSQVSGTGTFSASLGTAASVCTVTMGGSMQTIQAADTASAAEDVINIQSGNTYGWTAEYTRTKSNSWVGYNTTHGDITRPCSVVGCPVIQATTSVTGACNCFFVAGTPGGTYLSQSIDFEDTTGANGVAVQGSSTNFQFIIFNNCKMNGFNNPIIYPSAGTPVFIYVNATEISNAVGVALQAGGGVLAVSIFNSYFHTNGEDLNVPNSATQLSVEYSIFAFGTGLFCDICLGNTSTIFDHNVFYKGAGNYIDLLGSTNPSTAWITNNVFYGNALGGIEHQPSSAAAMNVSMFNNAFGGNGTANQSPYLNPTNINLTVDPFVNGTSGNFALNSTSGGGLLLKGHGFPATFGATSTNLTDVGPVQSAGGVAVSGANYGQSN